MLIETYIFHTFARKGCNPLNMTKSVRLLSNSEWLTYSPPPLRPVFVPHVKKYFMGYLPPFS